MCLPPSGAPRLRRTAATTAPLATSDHYPGPPARPAEAGAAVQAGATICNLSGLQPLGLAGGGISMALYMYQASYTARSMAAQIKEPQDPVEAFRPTLEDLGAKLLVAGFPFGDYDVLVVYEA